MTFLTVRCPAVRYYREALALEPTQTFTRHFINNNLGFFS